MYQKKISLRRKYLINKDEYIKNLIDEYEEKIKELIDGYQKTITHSDEIINILKDKNNNCGHLIKSIYESIFTAKEEIKNLKEENKNLKEENKQLKINI